MIRHKAKVVDNNDPEKRGRIKFASHTLLGGKVHPEWAEPMFPFAGNNSGWFFIPEVGQIVEIEFDDEENSANPRWVSTVYTNAAAVPTEVKEGYPKVRLLKTPSGHQLLFDDSPGDEKLKLIHKSGAQINIDKNGNIEIRSTGKVTIDASQIELGKGAGQKLVLGDAFLKAFNTHTHPPGGPPSPLTPSVLSTVVKTK